METLEEEELCYPDLLNTSCRRPKRPPSLTVVLYILLSSISVLTVALNLLVIISISHYRQLRTQTNLLLLSLGVSDLLVGFIAMPFEILHLETCWTLGDFMCGLSYLVIFTITSASVGTMVLISVDRYVAICDPLHYSTRVTRRRVQLCIGLCWVFSVLYNGIMLNNNLRQPGRYNSCYGECVMVINYIAGAVDLCVNFIGPITVIIVLCMRVFVVAVSQARAMQSHGTSTRPAGKTVTAKRSERKAGRTLGIIIAVFLICFCPYYYPALAGQDTSTDVSAVAGVTWLLYVNSCLNPMIYAFFYPWFRKAVKLIVTLQILQPDSCNVNIV